MGKFTLPKIHAESSPLIIGALWPLGIFPSHSLHGIAIKWRKTQPVGLTFPAFSASNLGYLWCKTRLKVELPIFCIVSADSLHVEAITRVFDAAGDHAKMMEAWWKLGAGDSIKRGINGMNGINGICWFHDFWPTVGWNWRIYTSWGMVINPEGRSRAGSDRWRAIGLTGPVNRARSTGRLTAAGCPVDRLTGRLTGWQAGWLADRPVAWLTGRLPGWPADRGRGFAWSAEKWIA